MLPSRSLAGFDVKDVALLVLNAFNCGEERFLVVKLCAEDASLELSPVFAQADHGNRSSVG
jgi:hypothetical protein